jgi:hypothetical protein
VSNNSLRQRIEEAWKKTCRDYDVGRINSERTLQAVLFGHLRADVPECSIFCEPQVSLSESQKAIPDLLVVNDTHVVAAIELKFVPHRFPVFEKDVDKLRRFGALLQSVPIRVALDPRTGRHVKPAHRVGADCLLVFAAIGRHDARAVDRGSLERFANLGERFVALTHSVRPPVVIP